MKIVTSLARHYAYLLPGPPIAVFSFSLLAAMTAVSLATAVIWVGALLMPLTLMVASGFAELDRSRLRYWGMQVEPMVYRPPGPGLTGPLRLMGDPRRWLDLVFEALIALPLRLLTGLTALVWTLAAPAGITYFFWSLFLPEGGTLIQLLELIEPELVPESASVQYLLDSSVHFVLGLMLLVTLPRALTGLARADAQLTAALLGSGAQRTDDADAGRPTTTARGTSASFSPQAWSWIGASFAAVVLLAVGWPVTAAVYQVPVALAMVLVAAHSASVVLALRWAWLGLGLSLAAAGTLMLATFAGESVWPWPVTALITQCAALAVGALARPWYYAASAWCAGAVLTLAALLGASPGLQPGVVASSIVFASVSAAVVLIGSLARLWILNAGRLEAAERSSAEQDRRSKELQERNRIARELHDVVAHSMSVISVQAATAQYRNPGMDEAARREFAEIAGSSRQALGEMRMLLSILRGEGDEAPTAPEPGLEDIDALVEATRASGTPIRHRGLAAAELPATSSATGLAAYRIVQEALSNALRHAPSAEVSVDCEISDDDAGHPQLRIRVVNTAPPEPAVDPAPGAGLGLAGLRERAAAVGGQMHAGPTPDGGFSVQALLPLR